MNIKQSIIGTSISFVLATSCCWIPWLAIAIGSATGLVALEEGLQKFSGLFMSIGIGFMGFGLFRFYKKNKVKNIKNPMILESTITCPECGHRKKETMPTNACQFFYECDQCKVVLKPKAKDCCVYCSYGDVACPPIQMNQSCCD